jgi:hypothetical protein
LLFTFKTGSTPVNCLAINDKWPGKLVGKGRKKLQAVRRKLKANTKYSCTLQAQANTANIVALMGWSWQQKEAPFAGSLCISLIR